MGNCCSTIDIVETNHNLTEEELSRLSQANYQNVPLFSFEGLECPAKVVKVYDGDTIHIAFFYHNQLVKIRGRMTGYDSAEMRPNRAEAHREQIIAKAIQARDTLNQLIGNQLVFVKFGKFEKWGRPLITIYHQGRNINQYMVNIGMGIAYSGGTKPQHIK